MNNIRRDFESARFSPRTPSTSPANASGRDKSLAFAMCCSPLIKYRWSSVRRAYSTCPTVPLNEISLVRSQFDVHSFTWSRRRGGVGSVALRRLDVLAGELWIFVKQLLEQQPAIVVAVHVIFGLRVCQSVAV